MISKCTILLKSSAHFDDVVAVLADSNILVYVEFRDWRHLRRAVGAETSSTMTAVVSSECNCKATAAFQTTVRFTPRRFTKTSQVLVTVSHSKAINLAIMPF